MDGPTGRKFFCPYKKRKIPIARLSDNGDT